MLGSFKIKLVGTFLALSVVPLAAAFWGFSAVAERSVTSGVDDRLEAGLNAALAAFEDERQNAEAAAQRLGKDRQFQLALANRDRAAIEKMLPHSPPLRVETPDGFAVGTVPRARRRDVGRPRRPGRPFRADHRLGAVDPGAGAAAAHALRSLLAGRARLRRREAAGRRGVEGGRQRHDPARAGTGRDLADRRSRVPRDRHAPRAGEHDDARRGDARAR